MRTIYLFIYLFSSSSSRIGLHFILMVTSRWQLRKLSFLASSILDKENKTPENALFLMGCYFACIRGCSCQSVWKMKQEASDGMKTRTVNTVSAGKARSVGNSSWGVGKTRDTAGRSSKKKQLESRREFSRERSAARVTPAHRTREEKVSRVLSRHVAQRFVAHMPRLSQPLNCDTSERISCPSLAWLLWKTKYWHFNGRKCLCFEVNLCYIDNLLNPS